MTDRPAGKARRTTEALAHFLTHVQEIRDELRTGPSGDDGPVDRLLTAVRDGGDVDAAVRLLHEHLQADGDPRGLYGRTRGTGARLAGIGSAARPLKVYLCPHRRCLRHHWPQTASGGPPTCELDGTPLLLKNL